MARVFLALVILCVLFVLIESASPRAGAAKSLSPSKARSSRGTVKRGAAARTAKSRAGVARVEGTAAQRLTPEKHREKFQLFLKNNPHLNGSSISFEQFVINRQYVVKRNDALGGLKFFSSSGPFAAFHPDNFKRLILTTTKPVKYMRDYHARNRNVTYKLSFGGSSASATKKKKTSLLELEQEQQPNSGAGGSARIAGGAGQIAGSKGGSAGGAGQIAGSKGGDAGGSGAIAGSKGGDSGGNAGIAGSKGGSGGSSGPPAGSFRENGGSVADASSLDATRKYLLSLGLPAATWGQVQSLLEQRWELELSLYGGTVAARTPQVDGLCGSCWAHTTMFALTVYHTAAKPLNERFLVPPMFQRFSPQQIIDCVKTMTSAGCEGGSPMDALTWLSANGVGLLGEFPLITRSQSCRPVGNKIPPSNSIITSGFDLAATPCKPDGDCPKQALAEIEMLNNWSRGGKQLMIIVYVDASQWQSYKSGIFPIEFCSSSVANGNHVVIITGFGVANGRPYWKLQNSWGDSFGEDNGTIRLPFGVNACGIANFPVFALPPKGWKRG